MAESLSCLIFRSFIFTFFIPGTVVGGIPALLYFFLRGRIIIGSFRYIGVIFVCIGTLFYLLSVISFINQGSGTPMIYFMKKTEKIFGKEPKKLVSSMIYKFSRNPMYFGVVLTTFGVGILLESISVITWAILSFIIFHFVIIKLEEPHLREKYREFYIHYCNKTPRWILIKRITIPGT